MNSPKSGGSGAFSDTHPPVAHAPGNVALSPVSETHTLRDIAVILLIALVLFVPPLFTRDVWYPDGARYMEVAREMVALGDYIVPHLNGKVYTGKPPLQFWLSAGLYRAGLGIDSGRVVAGCMSLGIMLLVYVFGRKLLPRPGGLLAAAITGTTFLLHDVTKQGVIDPLLTFLTTTAFMAAYLALRGEGKRHRLWWLLFYGAAGLAILAKGPVGFVMPGCVVGVYALLNRKHVAKGRWLHAAGLLVFLAVLGAWLIPAMIRGGEIYTRAIILGEQAIYTVKASSHVRGPHYYLMKLPFHLFPWFFFAALGTAQCLKAWRNQGDRDAAFLAVWLLGVLAFFTIVPSKRGRYLMPLVPAFGLITARYLVLIARNGVPWSRLHKGAAMLTLLPAALGALLLIPVAPIGLIASRWMFADDLALKEHLMRLATVPNMLIAVALALGVLPVALMAYRMMTQKAKPVGAASCLVGLVLLISAFVGLFVHPLLHPVRMRDFFAANVLPMVVEADVSYLYGNEFCGAVNLYTGVTAFPVIEFEDEAYEQRVAIQALERPEKVVVMTDEKKFRKLVGKLPDGVNRPVRTVLGHRDFILLRNWGEGKILWDEEPSQD